MLFNKFQYDKSEITKNDYFQTGVVKDENGTLFLAKWILDIPKDSQKSKILSDKLRHLQKAVHPLLPKIVQYGYDEEECTYAIVYEYIGHYTLRDYWPLSSSIYDILSGLIAVADCLCALHTKNVMSHGNLTPDNILIDSYYGFHLTNFGLADIAKTLGKGDNLSPFDPEFAAPEKYAKVKGGFPYQADIYSFGKIIEWVYERSTIYTLSESDQHYLRERVLAEDPATRPTWKEVIAFVRRICFTNCIGYIRTDLNKIDSTLREECLSNLNSVEPCFCISPKSRDENKIYMSIKTDKYRFSAVWIVRSNRLVLLEILPLDKKPKQNCVLNRFEFDVLFDKYHDSDYTIGTSFLKWFSEKQKGRNGKEISKRKLDFYDELMDKEIEVIRNHSLRIQYDQFEVRGNEVHFSVVENEKCSTPAGIWQHIDQGNDVNADPIRYVVSANGDIGKNPVSFIGTPLFFEKYTEQDNGEVRFCFKIKDHQYFDPGKTPVQGYLVEDCEVKIEEKRRQKEAIRKVLNYEVQNIDLIHYLFKPNELKARSIDYADYKLDIKQKGIDAYSYNQKKAIVNALERTPLSVIQGPPGTGKTTVITEIVFQLLEQKPNAKILITSQTNNAVDQVLENLLKNDIPILRLCGLTEPRMETIKKHTIRKKLNGWKENVIKSATKNLPLYKDRPDFEDLEELHHDWLHTVSSIKEEGVINQRLVDSIRVIGATCNHIAAKRYSQFNFEFDYIIMDESGKATVSESLVPIVLGRNLIFVGDHRQLKPMLTADREVESWLRNKFNKKLAGKYDGWDEYYNRPSLFESVIDNIDEDHKTQLTECRRSSEEQVRLTSECFYEPEGDEAIEYVPRPKEKEHNLPLAMDGSVFMIDIGSEERHKQDGQLSSFNPKSAEAITSLLSELNKCDKVRDYSVGLITAYRAQHCRLRSKIRKMQGLDNILNWREKKDEEKFTVSVIDRFQGLERDIVIVDLVKSGPNLTLGFLETPNRINVALSRQKKLLFIVGDYHGLINARTRRCNGEKCALQNYLERIPQTQIIKLSELKNLVK